VCQLPEVCQLNSGSQLGRGETPDKEVGPASLTGITTKKTLSSLRKPTAPIQYVHATCDDISLVHSTVICEENVSPKGSMASEVGVPDVPFTWEH